MTRRLTVDLEGRCALVTGGGTGIGRAISLGLARCGARVVVNYSRSVREAEATVAEIAAQGGQALAVRADVTDEDQVRLAIATAVRTYGGLDILMANAGGPTERCSTAGLSSEDWDAGLNLNCKSVFLCIKHAVPHLPDGRGRILITSSISARSGGGPGTITYTAAKGALNNLVRGWAKEFAPRGITVNAISPGRNLDPHPPAADASGGLPGPDRAHPPGPRRSAGGLRGGGPVPGQCGRLLHHRTDSGSQRRHADAVEGIHEEAPRDKKRNPRRGSTKGTKDKKDIHEGARRTTKGH